MAYDASAIQVLEGLEAVRKRPGMYIGSTGERGLHHLVYEVVDNAVDEALAGLLRHDRRHPARRRRRPGRRQRPRHPGRRCTRWRSSPAVEVVLTVLHAGGKFGGGGYSVSGGLHGVGVSVVNALSHAGSTSRCAATATIWTQSYRARRARGGPRWPRARRPTDTGTTVTFWADPDIFETTDYDFETLARRFQEMAFLNKGLTITLIDERAPATDDDLDLDDDGRGQLRSVRYHYAGGIVDFVEHLNASKGPAHPTVIDFDGRGPGTRDERRGRDAVEQRLHRVGLHLREHDQHPRGRHPRGGLPRGADRAGEQVRPRLGDPQGARTPTSSGEDIREGLTAIVSVKLAEPQFEGQTKTKLGNTEAKAFVQKVVNDQLGDWFEQNPAEGKEIARKAVAASARPDGRPQGARPGPQPQGPARRRRPARQAASTARANEPEECEVFIVEGDSAGGSARAAAATRATQAILPIRGKILNVEKARLDRVLANNEVQAMISALGTGIHDEFDIDKLRYHKIVLMADADVDGQHIRTLLLTLLFRFMRPLIEDGHVYLAQPPLYRLKWTQRRRTSTPTATASATRCIDAGPGGRQEAAQGGRRSSATRVSAR